MAFKIDSAIDTDFQMAVIETRCSTETTKNGVITAYDVLKSHFLIAEFFFMDQGQNIYGIGIRDAGLLHSAVARQETAFAGREKWTTNFERTATLFFGLVKNHAFHDGNKRTALLIAIYQLQQYGFVFSIPDTDLDDFTVEIAESSLSKYKRHKHLAKTRPHDADVLYIADYLKRNTKKIKRDYRVITFHQLNGILKRFGFELANPSGNHIDIKRFKDRKKFFGIAGPSEKVGVKVAQIGFPGWTKQVNREAIRTVRESTGLVAEKGFDSDVFFDGADPLGQIIRRYREPLRRLADK